MQTRSSLGSGSRHPPGAASRRRLVRSLGTGLLALASIAFTLGVAEMGVRLAGFQPIYQVYSQPTLFWQPDELLGWSHSPGASGRYVGPRPWPIEFEAPVEINALGLRGPEISDPAPDELRVLFLGDSVVAAFEVPYAETFVALLEARLTKSLHRPVRVVNAGVRGYGTDQSLLYLRDRGFRLRPDLVVFLHSENDPEDNVTLHRMLRPFGKPAFQILADGSLELRGYPVPRYAQCSSWRLDGQRGVVRIDSRSARSACWLQFHLADRSALFTAIAFRIRENPAFLERIYRLGAERAPTAAAEPDESFRLTSRLIRELGAEAARHGAGFLAILTDDQIELLDPDALRRDGVPFVVLTAGVAPGVDPLQIRFRHDSHYTTEGHRLFAEFLEPVIGGMLEQRGGRRS